MRTWTFTIFWLSCSFTWKDLPSSSPLVESLPVHPGPGEMLPPLSSLPEPHIKGKTNPYRVGGPGSALHATTCGLAGSSFQPCKVVTSQRRKLRPEEPMSSARARQAGSSESGPAAGPPVQLQLLPLWARVVPLLHIPSVHFFPIGTASAFPYCHPTEPRALEQSFSDFSLTSPRVLCKCIFLVSRSGAEPEVLHL